MVETFYLHLEFKNNRGKWSINLPFLCDKCGVCCTLDDFLTAGEIGGTPQSHPEIHKRVETLFEMLGDIWKADESKYEKYITHNACPFLVNKSCSIYEIRPEGCRLFPKTAFGMQTQDCEALTRFIRQRAALRKGRAPKETYHFTTEALEKIKCSEQIKPAKLTKKQHQACITKLRQAGMTDDELELFEYLNGKNKYSV
jgi:Fe-S-cluster containining protein